MINNNNLKTLIVDDHMIMRNMVEKNANALGFRKTEFAVNGKAALEKIQESKFDIILADWNMPELSGFELLTAVREKEDYNDSAFVMITAESEKEKILDVMSKGATAYLAKPFTDTEFKEMMDKVIVWLEENRGR